MDSHDQAAQPSDNAADRSISAPVSDAQGTVVAGSGQNDAPLNEDGAAQQLRELTAFVSSLELMTDDLMQSVRGSIITVLQAAELEEVGQEVVDQLQDALNNVSTAPDIGRLQVVTRDGRPPPGLARRSGEPGGRRRNAATEQEIGEVAIRHEEQAARRNSEQLSFAGIQRMQRDRRRRYLLTDQQHIRAEEHAEDEREFAEMEGRTEVRLDLSKDYPSGSLWDWFG